MSSLNISLMSEREKAIRKLFIVNELLQKKDIDEKLRSQFVGTILLYVKNIMAKIEIPEIDDALTKRLNDIWNTHSPESLRADIRNNVEVLLEGSENKEKKTELLLDNILNDQKVKNMTVADWAQVLNALVLDVYKYLTDSRLSGQDILNLFFITFNKYTGKSGKNQAFTPDYITDFMCQITNVDRTKTVLDGTCGSGSFLVQAMVKCLADCMQGQNEAEASELMAQVKKDSIYGIEIEENAFGLATTNMLIHGDGHSNIRMGDIFQSLDFIKDADPDIILMNPPYNAIPKGIPAEYKKFWSVKAREGKEDPTKGLVFVRYLADAIEKINAEKQDLGLPGKNVTLAVLLPISVAIGTSDLLKAEKTALLEHNTLDAVLTLPEDLFYPGASVSVCCMVFTLGKPHKNADGTANKTFFGYYKDDGFKKKKNIGRVEQFDNEGNSRWQTIKEKWLNLFRERKAVDGLSALAEVNGNSEWLCEAYMKTDYTKLTDADFQQTINNYLAYLVKMGGVS